MSFKIKVKQILHNTFSVIHFLDVAWRWLYPAMCLRAYRHMCWDVLSCSHFPGVLQSYYSHSFSAAFKQMSLMLSRAHTHTAPCSQLLPCQHAQRTTVWLEMENPFEWTDICEWLPVRTHVNTSYARAPGCSDQDSRVNIEIYIWFLITPQG